MKLKNPKEMTLVELADVVENGVKVAPDEAAFIGVGLLTNYYLACLIRLSKNVSNKINSVCQNAGSDKH